MDSTCKPLESHDIASAKGLADTLARELQELEDASLRLKDMQQGLQEFLADYYTRVGPLLERLAELQRPVEEEEFVGTAALSGATPAAAPFSYRGELKRLYRELAKACHPDTARGRETAQAADYMQVINHAYRHENLASLWKLSLKLRPETDTADMARRLHDIALAREAMQASIRSLEESREYQLMQKAFLARLRGQDLIFRIEEDLSRRVDHALRRQKLQQLLAPLKEKPGRPVDGPV